MKASFLKLYPLNLVFFILFCFFGGNPVKSIGQEASHQTVVVLSLDGFRWDYPEHTSTPFLDRLAREGVHTALIPSFPSKTFPNHYSLATGLVPDHHGLVNNSFLDEALGRPYSMNRVESRTDPVFYGGEPIWVTARFQGVRTASFFWVGSEVAIKGIHPDIWLPYDESVPFASRCDSVISWLRLPEDQRPRLIMAYYHEPDETGHENGPESPLTLQRVHELDSLTGLLYDRVRALPDGDSINFIVLSDHGMEQVSTSRNVSLRSYIPESWPVHFEGGNPVFNGYASPAWTDSVCLRLKGVPHIRVWRSGEIPAHLQYGSNPRTGSFLVLADSAWSVSLNPVTRQKEGGAHGYDIRNTDMHAIFYASGPAFRKGVQPAPFPNVDIYLILSRILGIKPAPCDGNPERITNLLHD
jgi:predicted AlkP superfamily pyrophosphatase or phosphodiesterase